MTLRLTFCLLLLLGLAGCGNQDLRPTPLDKDTGVYTPPSTPTAPPLPALAPATDPLARGDTLAPPDPLATGEGGLPASVPTDLGTDDPLGSGPKMPTDHSHWLHGDVSDARVVVTLDDAPLGTFQGPVDKDITMRLRRGVNTIGFTYTPQGELASARLQVLESEHDPPIPPLITFSPPTPIDGQPAQPITQTFTFIAH